MGDFTSLGLRSHLRLKLQRKPMPEADGPQLFTDLFSTVVVENPEASPWLVEDAAGICHEHGDEGSCHVHRDDAGMDDDIDSDNFDGNRLPTHLDVDPQDLFLRPDDKMFPSCNQEDVTGKHDEIDEEHAETAVTTGSYNGIGYSRNSKFVDVKSVKRHMWDCIQEDIHEARPAKSASGFQDLLDRTVNKLSKTQVENLSIEVCFICTLHLCNEHTLELGAPARQRPPHDFTVIGPPQV